MQKKTINREPSRSRPSKKVLFLTDASMAKSTGGGRTRVVAAARQCRRLGRRVDILSFVPPHRFVTRFGVLRRGRKAFAREAEARVFYVPRFPLRRFAWISTIDRIWAGAVTAVLARLTGAGIVHSHGLRATRFALTARTLLPRLAVVSDFHGAVPEEAMEEHQLPVSDPRIVELFAQELDVLQRSDRLVFVSRAMERHYSQRLSQMCSDGGERDLSLEPVIPCAVDLSCKAEVEQRDRLRREHGLENRIVFCYAGSAESYQLPDVMTRAFAGVLQQLPNAFFMVLSHHEQQFRSAFEESGVPTGKFSVRGTNRQGVLEVLPMGDVGFMLREQSVVNLVASPTKLGEYCHCGVPVATTRHVGDVAEWIERHQIGCLVDLEMDSLVDSLVAFARRVMAERSEISRRCIDFVEEEMSWDGFGANLGLAYDSVEQRRGDEIEVAKLESRTSP